MTLVEILIKDGWLKSPKIIEAFRAVRRADFLENGTDDLAEKNEALPIGYGQTISQPLVVAFMLELLEPTAGDKILDVGSGSGWTSALLSHIVSENKKNKNGKVISIEIVPELKYFGEKNCSKYNFVKEGIAKFILTDGAKGYLPEAPYNNILVSASAKELPQALKEQVRIGGKIVIPINSSIWIFEKKSGAEFKSREFPGFAFVPLVEN